MRRFEQVWKNGYLYAVDNREASELVAKRIFTNAAIDEGIRHGLQERAARLDAALKALTGEAAR
jgi:hypothetical protein